MELTRKVSGVVFDLRVIVGLLGIILSVLVHELFHIIVHWGEIDSIHIFPDSGAIVEMIFTPRATYDLVVEEAFAYTITMVTLILTAMLIGDINDAKNESMAPQTVIAKDFGDCYTPGEEDKAIEQLSGLLGIQNAA